MSYQQEVLAFQKAVVFTVVIRDEAKNASIAMYDTNPIAIVGSCETKEERRKKKAEAERKKAEKSAAEMNMTQPLKQEQEEVTTTTKKTTTTSNGTRQERLDVYLVFLAVSVVLASSALPL
jgi:hypothetical protein